MKHAGKAQSIAWRMIVLTLVGVIGLLAVALLVHFISGFVLMLSGLLIVAWILFAGFTLYFFRDPEARVPAGPGLVLAPGHGKVDTIDTTTEPRFMGGECQRISIFLSVIDVHVQNAPLSGRITMVQHTPGQYLSALRVDCAEFNENVLIGIEASDPKGEKVGLRLIAGLIARRIVPWINLGDDIARGERISLIQFGSRVDVYLSRRAKIKVKLGDKVVGGETVLAAFE